jgi:uncharacterized protein
MTPQEAQMLQDLVNKVEGTQLTEKDPDAEALLSDGLARDPDALYKLAQTVLVQNLALNQARAQLQAQSEQLRQQLAPPPPQPARATSFLGSLLGHREPPAAPPPPPYQAPQYAPPQYQTVPQYAAAPPPGYAPGPYAAGPYAPPPSGAGSFLRSAATTAAGVAAGALAFEGIESLIHGGHEGFMGGGGYGSEYGGMGGGPVEETVVNNYYGDEGGRSGEYQGGNYDASNGPDMQPQGPYDDRSVDGPDMQPQGPYDSSSGGVEEASYDPSNDASFDDQNMDDSGFGDGGDFGGDSQV